MRNCDWVIFTVLYSNSCTVLCPFDIIYCVPLEACDCHLRLTNNSLFYISQLLRNPFLTI